MDMDIAKFRSLTVSELASYLGENGVSEEATKNLAVNKVSGRALLLFENELKDLLPLMGDLAIVRDIIRTITKVK